MHLLCLDIGSNTQDILFLDTTKPVENSIQLVLPAPTVLVAERIRAATKHGDSILLIGETMGGGACTRALKNHLEAGFTVYAVRNAALSFNDDLAKVASWGVKLVSPDEAAKLKIDTVIRMGDLSLDTFREALSQWGIKLDLDMLAVAVLDHGTAPPGVSQRISRFRHMELLLKEENTLQNLTFTPAGLPDYFTRMQAVARNADWKDGLVLLDTGVAAALGASLDGVVTDHPHRLVVNLGNSHTIAFLLNKSRVLGFFEHHTGRLSMTKLETLLERLVLGELPLREVWEDGGHGSLVIDKGQDPFLIATGSRRSLLESSRLNPYFAAPFGNMMLTGCFGLARAAAIESPEWRDEIERALLLS